MILCLVTISNDNGLYILQFNNILCTNVLYGVLKIHDENIYAKNLLNHKNMLSLQINSK